jgi:hypothetical protein
LARRASWANAKLRKTLNIGGQKEGEQTDLSRLSGAELIQQLADQAKELGIEIDLNYRFAQKSDERAARHSRSGAQSLMDQAETILVKGCERRAHDAGIGERR